MADRNYFYFKQRVTDDEMRAAFDGPELAIWNFAKDLGVFGIATGGDITEQSPVTGLYVDMSGPFNGYTQDGKRVQIGTAQVIDCSVDYLNNPTVPTSVGESRWISIHARFDRSLSDQRVDGNGNVVYWVQAESYELRIVSGVAASGGGHVKPDPPTDAILVADIELTYGQTTITTANIDETRKNVLVLATGDLISVDTSGWTKLDNASQHVQDTFDDIDNLIIDRDASGLIEESLKPSAGTEVLGDASNRWASLHVGAGGIDATGAVALGSTLTVSGDVTVRSGSKVLPEDASGQDLGDATHRWDLYGQALDIAGNLSVGGGLEVTAGGAVITGDLTMDTGDNILPSDATGQDLGDASHRWDAFLGTVSIDGNTTVASGHTVKPADAAGQDLGDLTHRWDLFAGGITLSGNLSMDATARVNGDLLPNATGTRDLGSSSLKWQNVYAGYVSATYIDVGTDLTVDGDATFYTNAEITGTFTFGNTLLAGSNGVDIGNATNRFDAYLNNIYCYGTLNPSADATYDIGTGTSDRFRYAYLRYIRGLESSGSAINYKTSRTVSNRLIDIMVDAQDDQVQQWGRRFGNLSLGGQSPWMWYFNSASNGLLWISLHDIPHGASISSIVIYWYGSATATGLNCRAVRLNNSGNDTALGPGVTSHPSLGNWHATSINLGGTISVDKDSYVYGIYVDPHVSTDNAVAMVRVTYSILNIDNAAVLG